MVLNWLLDSIFPRVCVGCGALGSFICHVCAKNLQKLDQQRCIYCDRASLYGLTHPGCRKKWGLDGAISGYRYSPLMKRLMKTIKYRLAQDALDELLLISLPSLANLIVNQSAPYRNLCLIPIPLHPHRYNRRGFNQSAVIARAVASAIKLPLETRALVRTRPSRDQARLLDRASRAKNVRDIFAVQKPPPLHLLLVDDVITSGSTVRAAAQALKRAGARSVYALSLARG